jgi:hypothetical protein
MRVLLALAACALVIALPLQSTNEQGPYRPWEDGSYSPRFVEGEGAVHSFFAESLSMIQKWALTAVMEANELMGVDDVQQKHIFPDRFFSFIPTYLASAVPGQANQDGQGVCFDSLSVHAEYAEDEAVATAERIQCVRLGDRRKRGR